MKLGEAVGDHSSVLFKPLDSSASRNLRRDDSKMALRTSLFGNTLEWFKSSERLGEKL